MAKRKKWIVTTSGNRPISEIKKDLVEAGFTVDQVLDEIGAIIGFANNDAAERLRAIRGVADVSPDMSFSIGPPDAPETW
jgi:hypothetical protein